MLNLQAAIKVIENFTIADAGIVTLQGVLIVFSVLVILMVVLYIMKLFAKDESAAAPKAAPIAAAPAANAPAKAETTDETIAAICAAVGAMSGDDPTKRLRVVSIQEKDSGVYVWKK